MNPRRLRILTPIALCLSLLLSVVTPGALFAQEGEPTTPAAPVTMDAPAAPDIDFATPMECIVPFQVAHIAAAIASVLPIPIPGWKTAADMAEFGANLALKGCPPHLVPPKDIVKPPPPNCELLLHLPIDATYNELHQLDEQFFNLLLQRYHVPSAERAAVIKMMESEYGRLENETYGSYSNVYGLVLPLELSDWSSGNYGDVGQPDIYHYNTDVHISLFHPGERINASQVKLRPGSYTLSWRADTLISAFDWIPTFLIPGSDSPSGQKAAKEAATEASKRTVKEAVKEVAKETTSAFIQRKAAELGKNLAKKGGMKAGATSLKLRQPYFVSGDANASTYATQRIFILDLTPPSISGVSEVIVVEAFLPGGASSGANMPGIIAQVTVNDDCDLAPRLTYNTPAFWPLQVDESGNPLPAATIEWIVQDRGAATPTGGVNRTTASQQVIVVDTLPPILLPPPPVIMETTGTVEVPLGSPQVFDVADLRPTIHYTASSASGQGSQWPTFGPGVHYVDWSATDRSRNSSEVKQQLVNIKPPGTNNPPVAFAQTGGETIQSIADEPIKITVRGQDPDADPISGLRDPIWFTVDQHPPNGFFIAPLYPYFIDDYRMTARYSPWIAAREGEEFAWQVAQSQNAMRQYVISLCQQDINRTDLPKDFVSWNGGDQKYMAVDDAGYSYIYDWGYRRCTHGGSTISPNGDERISVWDPNGLYVGEIWRSSNSRPLRDINFNVGQGTILATNSDGSTTGDSLIQVYRTQPQVAEAPIAEVQTYSLWNRINSIYVASEDVWRRPEFKNAASAAWDTKNNVLYVAGEMNLTGLAAFRPALCPTEEDRCLDLIDVLAYSNAIAQSTRWGDFPGIGVDAMRLWNIKDLAVDSTGALYVVANSPDPATSGSHNFHRIYKFAPATMNEDGSVSAGELMGWMGRCTSGSGCNYIDQHSIGFSCTDATCAVEGSLSGSGPGQFNNISAISIDPNDVLYAADSGNERVQRFTADGLFAGEARSQSSCPGCTGFVLGDFGSPGNISVNSSNFYIIDIDSELVHIFEASVIHSIDDTSAWVEYQSDTNYVGADFFTFRATDGFRTAEGELIESAPARVDINVSRNFRPPQAQPGLVVITDEDTPVTFTMIGFDLDGALDTLTYRITQQPGYGVISEGTAPTRTFTPDEDFYGDDSFTFVVSDGRFDSEPMTVPIVVEPVNDPPSVSIRPLASEANPLSAGVGFPFALDALIVDPDWDDVHSLLVEWGDGTSQGNGQIGADGSLSGPVILADSTFTSTVVGYHTYTSPGNKTLRVCATDAGGLQGCESRTVSVQNQVDLALTRQGHAIVAEDRRSLTYALTVENRMPASGGATATNVLLQESLAPGATYQTVQPNGDFTCNASGRNLTCDLGQMTVGSQAQVILTVAVGASVVVGAEIEVESRVESNTPEAIADNNELLTRIALLPQADFHVTSLGDGSDLNPGDGICQSRDGCTLRAAIEEANALAGAQTIALGYGVHQLNLYEEGGRLRVTSAPLLVTDDLTIIGLSPDRTIVNANGQSRVMRVDNATLNLRGLMLSGGAIAGDDGGGVLVVNGALLLEEAALMGNRARNGGGVMAHASTVTIRRSAFTDNRAIPDGAAEGSGGALHVRNSSMIIQNSTFSGNGAEKGGALANDGGTVALQNVTLIGNGANSEGGGIHTTGDGVSLVNTILAENAAPLGPNCLGRINSGGHNLLGNLDSCTVLGQTASNIITQERAWMNLARTFADTYAYDLTPQSRAVNAGSCQLAVDQRGVARPAGNGCDIGAIEYDPLAQGTEALYLPAVMR